MTALAQNIPINLNDIADINRVSVNGMLDESLRGKLGQFKIGRAHV